MLIYDVAHTLKARIAAIGSLDLPRSVGAMYAIRCHIASCCAGRIGYRLGKLCHRWALPTRMSVRPRDAAAQTC